MAFRVIRAAGPTPADPESLFRDLRARKVPGLLAHQADILREYHSSALDAADAALQLPTGSGKTLVGLLIGEWRRRQFGDRVVYLAPTRQLVNQVVEQATEKYGLHVLGFTGKKADYDPAAKSAYQNAESLAVTTYNSLFNINPFFDSPQILILDDAHSCENYISSTWSLLVERDAKGTQRVFDALAAVLQRVLSATDATRLKKGPSSSSDVSWVELIPTTRFWPLIPEIEALLDVYVQKTNLFFPWSFLKDHLHGCQVYVACGAILMRPLIAPTATHPPFARARQRIYMSATLGEGGELERVTGREQITRLQIPSGWDKQGIGRRYFTFPGRSLDEEETNNFVLGSIRLARRALYLTTDERTAGKASKTIGDALGVSTFSASEIEESKAPFVTTPDAVAIVANRYDGIDLVDDECRLLLVDGLPRATNLQERFLVERMGSRLMLDDRILTRVIQGFGRCTRSPTDYAAVIVLGEVLHTYLQRREQRAFLHPEVQAEIEFGIDQSKSADVAGLLANIEAFLGQSEDWRSADEAILRLRANLPQRRLPATDDLRGAVETEVKYQYAIWSGNFEAALANCRQVLKHLNDRGLRGYRAMWLYLAGSAAWLLQQQGQEAMAGVANRFFEDAATAAYGVRWLHELPRTTRIEETVPEDSVEISELVERMEVMLEDLGTTHDGKYDSFEADVLRGFEGTSSQFEQAQVQLGRLLGYEADRREESGAPDAWWLANGSLCLVFEDHSDANPSSGLSVRKMRQAASHARWIRDRISLAEDARIVGVLVTPTEQLDSAAVPHAADVRHWHLRDFVGWAKNSLAVVRDLRTRFGSRCDLAWRADAIERYRENKMHGSGVLAVVSRSCAEAMKTR